MKHRFLYFILLIFLFISCNETNENYKNKPIARVNNKYLYQADLKGILTEIMSKSDSAEITKAYIDKWVRKQLLLEKAEINLTLEQKDVYDQLEDYRSSLLIYKYEQEWIKQNLDTAVSDNEIEKYYNLYSSNFILDDNIVKALFIKIPTISPNINNVKKWYKSDKQEDLENLENYCFEFAKKYDNFNNDWISFNLILNQIPYQVANKEDFLKYNSTIETNDSLYYYFIKIKEKKLKGEVAPLNYVKQDISQIILNKRKLQLINELENNIYNDALNYGNIKIYE